MAMLVALGFPTASPAAVSSALAFCATYTTAISTATTGFPTRATGGCGTATVRYSSACSCKPTPTSNHNLVKNGGFEFGLSPWVADDVVNTKHGLTSPGDNSPTAFEFDQAGPIDPDASMHPASVNQDVYGVTVGSPYIVTFSVYFDSCVPSDGFLGVMLNHEPVYTFDACDDGQVAVGAFHKVSLPFTASSNPENVRFEFVISRDTQRAMVKLDNVAVTPA